MFLIQRLVTVLIAIYCESLRPKKICPKDPSPILLTNLQGPIYSSFSICYPCWRPLNNIPNYYIRSRVIEVLMKINRKHMNDQLYTVRDIIDIKDVGGVEHCLVWWQGFPKSQATWQPTQNMTFLSQWKQYYQNLKSKYHHENESLPIELPIQSSPSKKRETIDQLPFKNSPRTPKKIIMKPLHQQQSQRVRKSCDHEILIQSRLVQDEDPVTPLRKNLRDNEKSLKKEEIQSLNSSEHRAEKSKKIRKSKKYQVILRGKKVELQPMKVDLQIPESRDLPFSGKEVAEIRGSFIKNGEMMYEVQFQGQSMKEPILLHNKYLKLLWPKKLAEYLLGKIKTK